uniref:Uncharacterized protein n=1 Tax=Anopheles atroparvus TaxID=41427 RepID=A0A182JD92_ANOAO
MGTRCTIVNPLEKGPDVTKLVQTAQNTELFGTVSLLYAAIVPVGESIPPRTTSLAAATFNLMVTFANLDIEAFQDLLTSDQYTYVIKSFAKLPKQFDVITYPTLVTIIHENPSARSVVARDFSVEVRNSAVSLLAGDG